MRIKDKNTGEVRHVSNEESFNHDFWEEVKPITRIVTAAMIFLSWDGLVEHYKPIKNPCTKEERSHEGTAFETFGAELDYVQAVAKTHPRSVWTLFDNGSIGQGYHHVNRLLYFVTKKPLEGTYTAEVIDWESYLNLDRRDLYEHVAREEGVYDAVGGTKEHDRNKELETFFKTASGEDVISKVMEITEVELRESPSGIFIPH